VPSRRTLTRPASLSFARCWLTDDGVALMSSAKQLTDDSPCSHQDLDSIAVAEHAERIRCDLDLGVVRHFKVRVLIVHPVILTCLSACTRRYLGL
jgi:hypothetical protein